MLVTGASGSSAEFVHLLQAQGAQVDACPLIRIGPPPHEQALQDTVDRSDRFAWLVFTSATGVEAFARRRRLPLSVTPRIAAVGAATARAVRENLGRQAELVAERASASAIADELVRAARKGDQILLMTARDASPVLEHKLRGAGYDVEKADAYTTVQAPPTDLATHVAAADVISLASPSAVRALLDGLGANALDHLRGKLLACIGPATLMAARDAGLHVEIVPADASFAAMVEALGRYFLGRA